MEPLKVMIASDIHLGFLEKDPERGEDSFNTFEEILQLAQDHDVDMVLLGGDLFHSQTPSLYTMKLCIGLLRKYTMGDKPIKIQVSEVINEEHGNFNHSQYFPWANFEDPSLNISLPIFTIHGHLDDPSGKAKVGPMDLLHSMGLINYFGKYTEDKIHLSPILIQKGNNKLALYGMGFMSYERCRQLFTKKHITYSMPQDAKSWVKVLTVHQNRCKRAGSHYLPEKFLSGLPDLVVWGHEHEARALEWSEQSNSYIFQAGSTVITNPALAETRPKQVGILEINASLSKKFHLKTLKLKTVRRLYCLDIDLEKEIIDQIDGVVAHEAIMDACERRIDDLLADAELDHSGDPKQPRLPLIRLNIAFEEHEYTFNPSTFWQRFTGRVANQENAVKFSKKLKKGHSSQPSGDVEKAADEPQVEDRVAETQEDRQALIINETDIIIKEYFENGRVQLSVLPTSVLIAGVKNLVEKDANEAIDDAVELIYKDMDDNMKDKIDSTDLPKIDFLKEMMDYKESKEADEKAMESVFNSLAAKALIRNKQTIAPPNSPPLKSMMMDLDIQDSSQEDRRRNRINAVENQENDHHESSYQNAPNPLPQRPGLSQYIFKKKSSAKKQSGGSPLRELLTQPSTSANPLHQGEGKKSSKRKFSFSPSPPSSD